LLPGPVVRFGDPDVLPTFQGVSLIPLLDPTSGIHFIELDSHSRITDIQGENRSAFINGTVVKESTRDLGKSAATLSIRLGGKRGWF